jgi:2-phospho-L-lactate guanylyltransferase
MEVFVAVPVKDLVSVKQRLVGLLSADERSALVLAMLEDVLVALAASDVGPAWLVTREPAVMDLGQGYGARCLVETANRGHTHAVAQAQARAADERARRFLTIPGDVPGVTAQELRVLLAALDRGRGAAFSPSVSGLGTNGALLAPPDVMPLRFGEPSFEDHLSAARARGLSPVVVPLPGLALDIDGPDDLALLLEQGPATRTATLLRKLGMPARLRGGVHPHAR